MSKKKKEKKVDIEHTIDKTIDTIEEKGEKVFKVVVKGFFVLLLFSFIGWIIYVIIRSFIR